LIVIYGAPLAGKTTVAWELARSLGEKVAVVSADQLLSGSIAVSDADAAAELEMAHTQLRLMVANYLKNRYHVVVEGPFFFEREADIDQLVALMRHLAQRSMIVRLDVSEAVLAARAGATGREDELAAALRIRTAAKGRYGDRFRSFDSGSMSAIEIAASVRESLG
jgi:adenylate kinase family enzyme